MYKKSKLTKKMERQYAVLLVPGLLIFTVGLILPLFMALGYSFTIWNGISANKQFVGIANYINAFKDKVVWNAWWFTIKFTVCNTVIQNILALLLALMLDGSIKGKKVLRTIFFIPCLISAVVVGFVWAKLYGNVFPAILKAAGLNGHSAMLFGNEKTVLWGLLGANNWQWVGYWMLIYLAALQSVPTELYDSAKVDGANKLQQFRHVTIPMIAPAITICVVGITTGSLKVYDLLVSSTSGGPGRSSTSIIFLIYKTAIGGRQYGYGSALSVILTVVLLLVACIQLGSLRKHEVQM